MKFARVSPNGHYRALRLLSEGGHWELGMSSYRHGMRMRMGLTGRPPSVMDFCMGRDGALFPEILMAVLHRLKPLEERAEPFEIDAAFPWARTRPDMSMHLEKLIEKGSERLIHTERPDKR